MTASPADQHLRRVARAVRRLPGWSRLSHASLAKVRSNDTATDLLARLLGEESSLGVRVHPLDTGPGGDEVPGVRTDQWPVVTVLVPSEVPLERVVGALADAQRRHGGFRPLLVLETRAGQAPPVALARAAGYPYELLLPQPQGGSEQDLVEWGRYRATRLVAITDAYRAWGQVEAVPAGLRAQDLDLLAALAQRVAQVARRRDGGRR